MQVRTEAEPRTFTPVDSTQLSPEQLRQLRVIVERQRDYLARLLMRMDTLGFISDDPLRNAAAGALDAVERLARTAMVGSVRHGALKVADPYGPRDTGR